MLHVCLYMVTDSLAGQKWLLDPLEPELQKFLVKSRSSARVRSVLNCEPSL